MIRKILAPTDFSAGSAAAVDSAAELAKACHAEVVLLHVRDELVFIAPDAMGFVPSEDYARVERVSAELLDEQVRALCERGVEARGESVPGSAHTQILLAATRERADLIVMGTHGRRGFRRLVMGSVAERVSRTTEVPVLVVQEAPSGSATATVKPLSTQAPTRD